MSNTTSNTQNKVIQSSSAKVAANGAVQNPGFTPATRFVSEGEWVEWCESLSQKN